MSLICNTGRPAKDDALQNLTVNDTLRVNNRVKSTKAEIDRLCSQIETVQNIPTVLAGSLLYVEEGSPNGLELFLLPSGFTLITNPLMNEPPCEALWYTPQDFTVEKLQVSISSSVNATIDVSVGVLSSPTGPITNVSTMTLSASTTATLQTSVPSNIVIPAGSYVTIHISSTSVNLSDVRASWTLHLDP